MDVKNRIILILIVVLTAMFLFVEATPTGPTNINVTSNETTTSSSSGAIVNISGAYIAKLNVTAGAQNPHWKAFVGWIQGSFVLNDASGSTIYNWSSGTTTGEVYATRTSGAVEWSTITCASASEITAEETAMAHTGQDNISSTFSKTNDNAFVVGTTTLAATTCSSQNAFVSNSSQDTTFEEIIIHDETNIIYASKIEDNSAGYDGANYDFQMLIPENGSSSFTGATAYYLFVELD